MVDEGSWYVHHAWPHDGNPVESTNFVVYSDAASVEARHEIATIFTAKDSSQTCDSRRFRSRGR